MRRWIALLAACIVAASGCAQPAAEKARPEAAPPVEETPLPEGAAAPEPIVVTDPPLPSSTTTTGPAPKPKAAPKVPPPDPLLHGPFKWAKSHYDFGHLVVSDPTLFPYQYPVQVNGSVHAPVGPGPFPFVLLMHGRHGTCDVAGFETIIVPCADAVVIEPVNSFEGYDDLARNLASHGYVVASVNANGVNDRDAVGDAGANARAQLALHTLGKFAEVHATGAVTGAPAGSLVPDLKGRLDMKRIGLMGHSRGGEGVARAITLDAGAHGIDAVFALAPTDFRRWDVTGVHFATLLPYCDGDVSNLQGAWMYDDARDKDDAFAKHQVLAMGANHNWYNSVWTFDEGLDGPFCGGSGRDSAEEQRAHGVAVMASFLRMGAGGETVFAGYWDGSFPFPDTACGGPCKDRLHLSREPGKADRIVLDRTGLGGKGDGFATRESCSGTGCPGEWQIGGKPVAALEWTGKASIVYEGPWDVEDCDALSLRVGVPTDAKASPDFHIALTDAAGGSAAVLASEVSAALYVPPGGSDAAKTVVNGVFVPMERFAALDLSKVASVRLDFDAGAGTMELVDVMFQC
jgi:dienelactone hydrolase